jgi:hypothetical protein
VTVREKSFEGTAREGLLGAATAADLLVAGAHRRTGLVWDPVSGLL